jgi:tetratricopeptide (TPR) repeat protein
MRSIVTLFIFFLIGFINAQSIDSLKYIASEELKRSDFNSAINTYSKILKKDNKNVDATLLRAQTYYETSQYQKAILDCNKGLSLKIDEFYKYQILKIRGLANYSLANWSKASLDLKEYLRLYDECSINSMLAYSYYMNKEYGNSIKAYKFISELCKYEASTYYESFINIGECYNKMDSVQLAWNYAYRAYKLDSLNYNVLALIASIYSKEKEHLKSISYYNKMIETYPSNYSSYYYRAFEQIKIKEYQLAIEDMKFYLSNSKDSSSALDGIAYIDSKFGKYKEAIETYKKLLKKQPKSSDLNNSIAWTYYLSKDYKLALYFATKSIDLDRRNTNAIDTKGQVYFMTGNYNLAIQCFNEALKIDSTYTHSLFFKAACHFKLKEIDKACEIYRKIKNSDYIDLEKDEEIYEDLLEINCKIK